MLLPQMRSPVSLLDYVARELAGRSTGPAWLPGNCTIRRSVASRRQNRLMFRGPSWVGHSCVPLCSPYPTRRLGNRVALEKINSSGASSRLAPGRTRKLFPIACRRRSVLRSPAALFFPLPDFPRRRGLPSRSLTSYEPSPRVAKAKFSATSLWITGISGTTIGLFEQDALWLPIRS
jgi:hypothetical protein